VANIPAAVKAIAEQVPAEDIALAVLRAGLTGVPVVAQIQKAQTFPVVLVRRLPSFLDFKGDARFLDPCDIAVHAFAEDPDGDQDAAILSEACRVLLRNAWLDNWHNDGLGSIAHMEILQPPRRIPDWATASGPVQFADLPSNVWRYEGRYRLIVRKPRNHPYPIP
jgi:hypothetical protein